MGLLLLALYLIPCKSLNGARSGLLTFCLACGSQGWLLLASSSWLSVRSCWLCLACIDLNAALPVWLIVACVVARSDSCFFFLTTSCAVSGQTNTRAFQYDGPSIIQVTPSSGSTVGGYAMTIDGASFDTGGVVRVGGKPCAQTSWTHSKIVCTAPAGQGANIAVSVTTAATNLNATASNLFSCTFARSSS